LCVDTLGNVYVTGRSDTVKSSDSLRIKFATIKYSSNGDLMWIKKFIDSDSIIAIPNSICIDDSMNIYITGHCYNFNPNGKAVIVKYDRNGKYIWAKTLSTSDRFEDFNNIFYKNNFIYLTGGASGSDTNTIKCNLNGDLIWEANFMTVGKKY
jgi:hypothetical protein